MISKTSKPIYTFKERIKNLREVFLNWSLTVDINGYNKIFHYREKSIWIKLLWIAILLASTGLTFCIIGLSIVAYLKYDVVTQTNLVYEIPTKFPAVTFCNVDPFTTKESQDLFELISNQRQIPINNNSINPEIMNLAKIYAANPEYGDDNRHNLGLKKELVYNCLYNSYNCSEDLAWYYLYEYGSCFQFLNKNLTSMSGTNYGLELSIGPLINYNKYLTIYENGLVVFVHDQSVKPSPSDKIFIKAGEMSLISVDRTFHKKTPFPYSDCIDLTAYKSNLYDFIVNSNQVYRQEDCFDLCIQQKIIDTCQCYFTGYPRLNDFIGPCLNSTEYNCLTIQIFSYSVEECSQKFCPLECDSIENDVAWSSLSYASLKEYNMLDRNLIVSYEQALNQNLTYELYKSLYLGIRVYYPTLQYTTISESPKTSIVDLLTQIGGSLGLFVSFSVFTLFELFELLVLVFYYLILKNRNVFDDSV